MTLSTRTTDGATVRPLSASMLTVMTVAAGLSVAGNYFTQPLLGLLRTELGMSTSTAGLTVAMAQVGYALGLALLVPLGDRYSRRGLSAVLLAATGVLLAVAGFSPNGPVLLVATGLAAATSVGAQVLVPFAAELSASDRRGRNVGVVMAGVLAGGLVGRAFAGVVADLAGWRTVYWITAGLLLVVALMVSRSLPASRASAGAVSLVALLRSTAALWVDLPALRRPIVVASLAMASYIIFLATITLLLVESPYGWSPAGIGLVGLIGAVGPLSMPLAGRFVDAGRSKAVLVGGLSLAVAAWLLMLPAQSGQIAWLLAGIILINVGQTAMLNSAQTTCYELWPEARSRINAIFMTIFFTSGAIGGVAAPYIWLQAGWTGVCVIGVALTGTALLLAALATRKQVPTPAT